MSFSCFLESGFKVLLGLKLVVDLFLADTESLEGQGLALHVLELVADVETAFVEITSGFKVIKLGERVSQGLICFEAFLGLTLTLESFTFDQRIFKLDQIARGCIESTASALVQLEFLLKQRRGVNIRGGFGFRVGQVEEIDVGLHVTLSQ